MIETIMYCIIADDVIGCGYVWYGSYVYMYVARVVSECVMISDCHRFVFTGYIIKNCRQIRHNFILKKVKMIDEWET